MDEQTYIYITLWVETIETALNNVANSIKDVGLQLQSKDGNIKDQDDFGDIPLDSVHHPQNPSYLNDNNFEWKDDINMWRPK